MIKKSGFLWLILAFSVLALCLTSCKNDPENTDNTPGVIDEDVIFSPYVKAAVILGEGIDENDVVKLRSVYYKQVGKEIPIESEDSTASHRIIVGKTEHELSDRAYRYLSRFKGEGQIGYVIYSDGKSVAIAFDDATLGVNLAFDEAINHFVSNYMQKSSLKLGKGAVSCDSFFAVEKQQQIDDANEKKLWDLKLSQISAKLDGNKEAAAAIVTELKNISQNLNQDYKTVIWLANLYDPVTGGFYYSNSARNNIGYAPDLESTSQAIGIVEAILNGYGGTLTNFFGEEIAAKFVSFAKNMQKENGYFYHPQWDPSQIDKNLERREMDVLAALNILKSFNASPTYDINGVKGDGIAAPVSSITLPLEKSKLSAVSNLVTDNSEDNEIYIPAYLKSRESFLTYLAGMDIQNNTISVCSTLYSEISLYKAVDELLEKDGENYRLCDLLENYISQNQNSYTGLWSEAKDISYDEVGELTSAVSLYNALGKPIPNYNTIFNTLQKTLNFSKEINDISEISNAWSALAAVTNNLTTYTNELYIEDINGLLTEIYSDFSRILITTGEKLRIFLNDDGSFSTTSNGSAAEQFGMSVAIPATKEGDINATLLATKNIWLAIFQVLNIGDVPVFNVSDRMMFQQTLLDMGVIIKNEIKKTAPRDFEDNEPGGDPNLYQILTSSKSYSTIAADTKRGGNALHLYHSIEAGWDNFYLGIMSSASSATCFAYEFDMCVLPESSDGKFGQLFICEDAYMISIYREGDEIMLIEGSSRGDSDSNPQDLGVRPKVGEWFNLRIEYYPGTSETVRTKIYYKGADDEESRCIVVSDKYYGDYSQGNAPVTKCLNFAVFGYPSKAMSVLMDNIVTETTYKTYNIETSSSLNKNVDTPDKNQTIHGFENSAVGSTPSGFIPSGDASALVVVEKADDEGRLNKLLSISENAGEIILPLDQRGLGINSALVEFDITVSSDSAAGSAYRINFNEFMFRERTFGAMQLTVIEEDGNKYLTIADVSSGSVGSYYSNVKLPLNQKHHLRFHLFFGESTIVVSVDNEVVGINTSVLNGIAKLHMGETTIESITSSKISTIFIDNITSRIYSR